MKTAILFLVFNRPDTTKVVFEKIRQAKPLRLYVSGDGARYGFKGEKEKIKKVREIATKVDWPCELKTFFRDKNLGCKQGVSSGIDWFFDNEEQGIILEDDCVPHLDFFTFCENMLNKFAKDERISVITGNNFQNNKIRGDGSYYFSKYNHCWGWASWKRAWKYYNGDLKFWTEWRASKDWFNYMPNKYERKYWEKIFDLVYEKKIDSWAYPWLASVWYKEGLTVTPNVNLVSNIGFGEDATHTKIKNDKNANMKTSSLKQLKHPTIIKKDIKADNYTFNNHFEGNYIFFPFNIFVFPHRVLNYIFRYFKKTG